MKENCDEIDFNKLEKEFQKAVEADSKYARENAAKFRAVEQRVGSYDEFRNIVLASNLKPLDKKDITGRDLRRQPLNVLCGTESPSNHFEFNEDKICKANTEEKDVATLHPNSPDDFIKHWKKYLADANDRYRYLVQTENTSVKKIFVSESVANMLGEITTNLHTHFSPADKDKIIEVLKNLQLSKRFSLSLQFLSKSEKESLTKLFEKLEGCPDTEMNVSALKNRYLLS